MFRGIIVALFAGAVVTGLTSTVYAQPLVRSQPENGFTTRSGESLRGLESRNLSTDYPTVFPEPSSISEPSPISLHNNNSASVSQFPERLVLGNIVEINFKHLVLDKKIQINAGGSSLDSEQLLNVGYQLLSPAAN